MLKITEGVEEKLKIELKVKNKGNVHIRPTGRILIEDQKGKRIAELEMLSGRATLPDKEFIYYAFWEEPKLRKGVYSVSAFINYGEIFEMKKTAVLNKSFGIDKRGEVILK